MALNKLDHSPAGVLGIGMDAFIPPGASTPEMHHFGRKMSFSAKCRAICATLQADIVHTADSSLITNLLRSLRHRHDWTGAWYRRAVSALKYIVRTACMPIMHARFLAFVHAHPPMRAYRQRDPRMLERHMHRYVNMQWRRRQRLESVAQHYRFALSRLPKALFHSVYAHGHASLGMLVAKDGSLLGLCLRPPIDKGCEGELCLQLNDVSGHPLYRIVFSIVGERPRIVIGCLQGPSGDNAKERVRELTRNLHGMRPKQFMLSLLYAFARHYRITEMAAISNAEHPLRRSGRPLHADYDAFWIEQQGHAAAGGWYALPATQAHKSEADVPSNHRSAHRRREALRLQAERMLMDALTPPASSRPATFAPQRKAANETLAAFLPETSWVS